MNKKTGNIVLIALLILIVIIGISISPSNKNTKENTTSGSSSNDDMETILARAEEESANVKDSEKKELPQINVDTYLEYYNGKENKIILLARPTCHYCEIAEPIIQKVAHDYDLEINYLNTDNFEGEDESNFVSSNETFKEYGTPTLFIVSNGDIVDMVDGLTDYTHYEDFFKKNGFIK